MFGFYIGVLGTEIDDDGNYASITVDGFNEVMSGGTRDIFIEAGVKDFIEKDFVSVHSSRYNTPVRYTHIKHLLQGIRYKEKVYNTERLRIYELINNAVKEYGEENVWCMFT